MSSLAMDCNRLVSEGIQISQTIEVNWSSDITQYPWDNCCMFHETKLPSIHRVATRRVEIARALALNLKDESEITAAIEEISHVLYSALLVFREVDRLASEAKQRQALQRLAKAPNPTMASVLSKVIHILRSKAGIAEQSETARIAAGRM